MFTYHHHLILLLLPFLGCVMPKRWVVVNMANGGTSPPLLVGPLNHDHKDQPLPDALPLNAPTTSSQSEMVTSMIDHEDAHESGRQKDNKTNEINYAGEEENEEIQATGDEMVNVTPSNLTLIPTSTSISTSTSVSTTNLVSSMKMTTKITYTSEDQLYNSQSTTTSSQPPLRPCHLSCLKALNSTHLTPPDNLALSAGSSLTLECQIPLNPDLTLEDMLWLFHPGGTPEGRCSLTPHKYLPSCPGLPSLSETDYRNDTFLKQTLTLSDLGTNHTGDYICQVQVTCCSGHQQHLMSQQCETQVSVKVWWADYTLQLAGTGVVAGVLLLTLLGVSVYGWRHGNKNHYLLVVEVEAPAVLHLPLIDDQDADSFNSSITNEEEET